MFKMKGSTIYLGLLLLILSSCSSNTPEDSQSKKPNIIFLFADDQTFKAVHALGNERIYTPNMDRLVNSGVTFTHAYNMGAWNGAVCAASRAMMISGRYVWRANEFRQNWIQRKELDKTWGRLMEEAGYDTYMTGKWHVDAPADSVFQNVKHIRPGMPNDNWEHQEMVRQFAEVVDGKKVKPEDIMPIGYNRPKNEQDNSWSPTDPKFGGFWEGGKHWSEVLKDDALSFIEQATKKNNPFFMYLAFNAPHDPRQAPQEFIDQYPIDEIPLPESWQPEYPFQDSIGNGPKLRDEALAPFPRTEYATKKHIQEYYAIITHLDEQIGKILDALEASGNMDQTYIFFTADHGLAIGEHGLLGKQNLYDHSIRVPLMVMGPDILKGERINTDIYLQDIMATSLEIAEVSKPEYVEFNSFLNLANGTTQENLYEEIYGCYVNLQRMIRKDGYKLILYPRVNEAFLFNLEKDPNEIHNLAKDPAHQEQLKNLFDDLLELQQEMEDPLDLKALYSVIINTE